MFIYEGCTIEEVQAMRDLQDEPFDFGSGMITVDCKESEDFYFRSHLSSLEMLPYQIKEEYEFNSFMEDYDREIEFDSFTKDMTRSKRRKNNWKKAIKKAKNSQVYDTLDYVRYPNDKYEKALHLLDKGKSFCSCSLCTIKTNSKGKTYFGRTKIPYATRNWKTSDQRSIDACDYSLKEYLGGSSFNLNKFWYDDDFYAMREIELREDDQEMLFDYIFNNGDDVVFHHNTLQYREDWVDWIRRTNWLGASYFNG